MAEKGRGPDSMLVHMSPDEIKSLQALAMAHGGSLTINPQTGLPEAGFLDSLLPALVGFGLNMFLPGLGEAVGGIFGLTGAAGAAAGTGIAVGGATALATGDLGKGLMAGLGAYGGAGLGGNLAAAGDAAMMGPPTSAMGLPEGAAVQAASPIGAFDRLQAGAQIAANSPGDFLKSNYMNLGYAAAPGLSGAFDEEEASTGVKPHPGYIRVFDDNGNQVEAVKADEWGSRPVMKWGQVPKPTGYASGGGIEDVYQTLPYELPETNPNIEGTLPATSDTTAPTEEVKKGITRFGGVLAPDLTGHDLTDKRSDSEKAQDYLMGKGPNPFLFTSKAPVVDSTKKAAEATKEIAEIVDKQKEQRGGGGSGSNARGEPNGYVSGYSPDANSYTNGIVAALMGQQAVPASVVNLSDSGYATAAQAESAQNKALAAQYGMYGNPNAVAGPMSSIGVGFGSQGQHAEGAPAFGVGYGSQGQHAEGNTSGSSGDGKSARDGSGFGGTGSGTGGDGGGDGGGGGHGDARGGYLAHGQFDQRPRYADGGTTGSGSLDLHVPINIGGEGGGGGGGGGFGGGQYQPMGQGGGFGGGLGGLLNQGSNGHGDFGPQMQGGMSRPNPDFLSQQMNSLPGYQSLQKAQEDFQNSDEFKNFQNYAQEYQQSFGGANRQAGAFGGTMGGSRYGLGQGGQNGLYGGTPLSKPSYEQYLAGRSPYQQDVQMSREQYENPQQGPSAPGTMMATGGITALADGGMYNLGSYSDGGRLLRGPGDGVSDDIPATIGEKQPARLADGEFVVPARIVSELGNGSTEAGARKLYAMMDRVQKARHSTVGKDKIAANTRAEKYLPA
jgi:hypothetical protein